MESQQARAVNTDKPHKLSRKAVRSLDLSSAESESDAASPVVATRSARNRSKAMVYTSDIDSSTNDEGDSCEDGSDESGSDGSDSEA